MRNWQTHLIPKSAGTYYLKFENGNTQNIIDVLLGEDKNASAYTKKFALTLKGAKLFDTCRNVYDFVKQSIPYKIDTPGYQWIKRPNRLWSDKKGDCKSFSLFIGSCLKNLGIGYGYRFTSYEKNDPTPTHVYVYVPLANGKELILDAVWKGPFNSEKPYEHKTDKIMAKIAVLGGVNDDHIAGTLIGLPKEYHDMSDAEFDLYLARQRAEIEQMNYAKIGSPYAHRWNNALAEINYAIGNIENPDAIIARADAIIGKAKKEGKKNKAGGLLKKIGTGIKKAAKAVSKVVTAPVRLAAKGALEIYLPKAAPAFLYLFTPANMKLPDLMARKKAKAEKFKNFVVRGISMKESHFMGIIRNALTKRFGKSPESYLQERLANRVSGIAGNNKKVARLKKVSTKAPVSPGAPTGLPKVANKLSIIKPQNVTPTSDQKEKKGFFKGAEGIVENAAGGNIAGAVLAAINWLISKISGGGKGEKVESFTADDLPDLERDASNAFEWQDMKEDYGNLTPVQKNETKTVATEMIEQFKESPIVHHMVEKIEEKVKEKLPFLNDKQVKEVVEEIEEGPEALDEYEGRYLGQKIKTQNPTGDVNMSNGGGTRGGICNC